MTQQQTINLLLSIQAFIGFLLAIRAFYLYSKTQSDELIILGISMLTIAIASLSGLAADNLFAAPSSNVFGGTYNVLWFQYGGQTLSYFFIFLSTLQGPSEYISRLKGWHIAITVLLLVVLLLTPIIPPFSGPIPQALLSVTRSIVCFVIFLRYTTLFFTKETRFSFLMMTAFLLLTFGIAIITAQFFPHGPILLVYVGYALRISGLLVFLSAFFLG